MPVRQPLSPLTNASPRALSNQLGTKYVSPQTSRSHGVSSPSSFNHYEEQEEGKQKSERRRKSQVFDLRRKNLGSPSTISPRQNEALNGLSSTELSNHYADCIKLSTENKINAKNAFGLHLIDYMTELVKKKEMENFQVASSTLDASVKIYAGRVDFIHSHTYKVLNGLGGGKDAIPEGEEDNEDGDALNKELDTRGKKKRKKATETIESNLKNINSDNFDLEFEVDPMFQVMSAAFDEGGARGLLLNRLRCFDNTQKLVLDSTTPVNLVEDVQPDSQSTRKPTSVSDLREMIGSLSLEDKQICPSLSSFRFNSWNGETSSLLPQGFSNFAFDPTAEPEHLPNVEEDVMAMADEEIEDLANDDDLPENGSAASESDIFSARDLCTAEFVDSAFSDLSNGTGASKLRQILALEPSDYSYFNKIIMKTWAGPSHWKIAPGARNPALPENSAGIQKKRTRKAPLRLTYEHPKSELDKMYKHSKATAVTKATWAKYTKKRTTLPEDQHLDSQDRLFKLFNKPQVMIKRQTEDCTGADDGIENYDYNNKNDVDNFCPVMRDNDDDDDFSSAGFDLSNENFPNAQDNLSQGSLSGANLSNLNGTIWSQDKLVEAPHKVDKIDIKYAKKAKRVDVRRLKSTIWTILTDKESENEKSKENALNPEESITRMSIPHKFTDLRDQLPSRVTTTMASNLTIQTVFACLLYITNEKTLKLKSTETMEDITIEQDNGL